MLTMKHPLDEKIFNPSTSPFERICLIVKRLRDPKDGCPWDKEQTHESLTPYVVEEAFEVVEAITHHKEDLKKELGDLLLQVLLHSEIASETATFSIDDVCEAISTKLITRHPHVFGDVDATTSETVLKNWEQIKQQELKAGQSILDGVPTRMPALLRAQRVSEKAARVGFEWSTLDDIKDKVIEEIQEFLVEVKEGASQTKIADEFGDIYFALTQVARRMHLDAESLLHASTDKFTRRFKAMEQRLSKPIKEMTLQELDAIWELVKQEEKAQVKA
jgi:MazG family protein